MQYTNSFNKNVIVCQFTKKFNLTVFTFNTTLTLPFPNTSIKRFSVLNTGNLISISKSLRYTFNDFWYQITSLHFH